MLRARWTQAQAWSYYQNRPLPYGFNFLPSTAVNSTEMWQAETFDPTSIQRELALAATLGFNSCRVFLPYLVWQENSHRFKQCFEQFLSLASHAGLSTMPVLFDDCAFAGKEPYSGPQDPPVPGIHNSGWTPSPGPTISHDYQYWPRLAAYVKDLLSTFAHDSRIFAWDLYNEPGNNQQGSLSLPLLAQAFLWAREINPTQPLTAAAWAASTETDQLCLLLSDIMTFHHYGNPEALQTHITSFQLSGYPVICTEWMARPLESLIATHLPLFSQQQVGCYLWGLVQGKTQTYFPWGSTIGAPEPALWFHDLFRSNGQPYNHEEIATLQQFSAALRR